MKRKLLVLALLLVALAAAAPRQAQAWPNCNSCVDRCARFYDRCVANGWPDCDTDYQACLEDCWATVCA